MIFFYFEFTKNKMKVGIIYEKTLLKHKQENGFHYERPERISTIYNYLEKSGLLEDCVILEGRPIEDEEVEMCHTNEYLEKLENNCEFDDNDMYSNKDTIDCVKLAAGSSIELVKNILNNTIQSGFAIIRPPGHHACTNKESGFCFLNNVALAAFESAKTKRTLIVDWDVHFGNGTYQILKTHPNKNIKFFSIHKWDNGRFYPGGNDGKSEENEDFLKVGFNESKDDDYYLFIFNNTLLPFAKKFDPEIIIVSCGFDAAEGDPLGNCNVTPEGYYKLTRLLQSITPNIALILEGGYNLKSIALSGSACVKALLKQ